MQQYSLTALPHLIDPSPASPDPDPGPLAGPLFEVQTPDVYIFSRPATSGEILGEPDQDDVIELLDLRGSDGV